MAQITKYRVGKKTDQVTVNLALRDVINYLETQEEMTKVQVVEQIYAQKAPESIVLSQNTEGTITTSEDETSDFEPLPPEPTRPKYADNPADCWFVNNILVMKGSVPESVIAGYYEKHPELERPANLKGI